MHALVLMVLLVGGARPETAAPAGYAYGAAAADLPPEATPQRAMETWKQMTSELRLGAARIDEPASIALGEWLNRPHVCTGRVRYHAVVAAERTLKLVVVAECHGTDVSVERAAKGLAEELAKRMGPKAMVRHVALKDVPARLWEARVWAGGTVPPDGGAASDDGPASR